MSEELTDTSPEVARRHRQLLLARSGEERLRMASQMFDAARRLMLASFPAATRDDPAEARVHFVQRLYGRDLDPRLLARIIAHLRAM